jgi:hypothetical protein
MLPTIVSKDYLGSRVRINPTTNLVCLTDICKASGENIADFLRLQGTSDYIDALSCAMGIPIEKLLVVGKGSKGTWGHPQLSIKCAAWVSAKFEVLVTSWVWELLTTGKVELQSTPTPAVVIATDDVERMHNVGHSIASRGLTVAQKKKKHSVPDGWLTVAEHLYSIVGDKESVKQSGVTFWLARQVSDLYRANNGIEPPTVPSKRGLTFCYPPEYSKLIASHYQSWAKTHADRVAAVELRLASLHKQTSIFDLPEAV